MWPFNTNKCTNHHYEGPKFNPSAIRILRGQCTFKIQSKPVKHCQHDGCNETKEEWITHRRLEYNPYAESHPDEEMHALDDVLVELKELSTHDS